MEWKDCLKKNRQGKGDPVTALYLPSGFVAAESIPLACRALNWVSHIVFAGSLSRIPRVSERDVRSSKGMKRVEDRFARAERERRAFLTRRYDPDAPKPLVSYMRVEADDKTLQVFLCRDAPFETSVSLTIRPHNPGRDGSKHGPPLVVLQWETKTQNRDEAFRLPETFGPSVRTAACAWQDSKDTGLTSVVFKVASRYPIQMPRRWSLLGIEWRENQGGVVCFGSDDMVGYLVTLPSSLSGQIVHRVADGDLTIYEGESYYLEDRPGRPIRQKI